MKILIVAATELEIKPLLNHFQLAQKEEVPHGDFSFIESGHIDVLITGVGLMASAFHLGALFANRFYRTALNFGIAGSFQSHLPIRSVAHIIQEELADFGAEQGEQFLDIFDLKLLQKDSFPFSKGALINHAPLQLLSLSDVPQVKGVSVNKILGSPKSVELVTSRYKPHLVNMEGAAFFYACLKANLPFLALRAVSDHVGEHNRAKWDIKGAVAALNDKAIQVVEELLRDAQTKSPQ